MSSKKSYWLGFSLISATIAAMAVLVVWASLVDNEGKLKIIEQCNFFVMTGIFALIFFHAEVKRNEISDLWLGRVTLCSVGLNSVLWWLIQSRVYNDKYHDWVVSLSASLVSGTFLAFIEICLAAMLSMLVYALSRFVVKLVNSREDPLFHTTEVSTPR